MKNIALVSVTNTTTIPNEVFFRRNLIGDYFTFSSILFYTKVHN